MFENLCKLPLQGDVFAQAIHPREPFLAVGLSSGRVQCFRLPAPGGGGAENGDDDEEGEGESKKKNGLKGMFGKGKGKGRGTIDEVWGTRRHKGSCRTLGYSTDGDSMFSAGADGIVKHFSTQTGRVVSKTVIPSPHNASGTEPDIPSLLHALDPNHLLLACDSGALHTFDLRDKNMLSERASRTTYPHTDYISSLVPLPSLSESSTAFPKQWVTTGGQTLAVTDLRSGTLVTSDDQEDDLLCATYVPGIGPKKVANKASVAVGGSTGILTLWDRGSWDDQQERVVVDFGKGGGESVDSVTLVPGTTDAVVGLGDGRVKFVDLEKRRVLAGAAELRHDEIEAVGGVGFDCFGRLCTAGGRVVQIWEDLSALKEEEEEGSDDDEEEEDDDDDEGDSDDGGMNKPGKRTREEDEDDSSEEDEAEMREKRRKAAIAARLGPMGAHGVLKFDDLD